MSTHVGCRRVASLLLAFAGVVGLAGCGGGDSGGGRGREIVIENFDFGEPVVVEPGDVVRVINADGVGHTWTSVDGRFDSGLLEPDDAFEFRFEESGEFEFFCSIHPSMTGSITVGT